MRLKIFSCHHNPPQDELSSAIYQTLVSGLTPAPGSRVQTDLGGRNIADAQKFCELRHQYYVWQNLLSQYDYIGFEHYRRPFYIDPHPHAELLERYPLLARLRESSLRSGVYNSLELSTEAFAEYNLMRSTLTPEEEARILAWVRDHDVISTNPIFEAVDANFRAFHGQAASLWEEFVAGIQRSWPYAFLQRYVDMPNSWSYYLNMYIMRAELFDEYMGLLFPVLLELEHKHPHAPPRIWGHMSERLFGAFVVQKTMERPLLRRRSIPHLFHTGKAAAPI